MKIVLLGYMGSGKSTIAALLAEKLGFDFIDLDKYIEAEEGQNISEIFAAKGEIYFRKQEANYLQELLANNSHYVLALGGGTPCYGTNMDVVMAITDQVFYLKASLKNLVNRLRLEKAQRPILANLADDTIPEFVAKHLFERAPYYEKATYKISVDLKSPQEIAQEIAHYIK